MTNRVKSLSTGRLRAALVSLIAVLGGLLGLTCCEPIARSAQAAEAHSGNSCANPQTQAAINACAAQQYREADARLNAVYRALMNHLSDERKAQLKAVQLAWITFREAHCKFVADPYEDGSLHPTIYSGCMTETAQSRANQLRQILKDLANQ